MLNRLALLTCHEMGHVLGLEHNFVASTYGRGSVMDYFAPLVRIRADGTADLSDAYMQGVGSYDRFAIEWGYSQGKPGQHGAEEQARLDAIVKGAIAKGIVWGNTEDPRWNSYDDGPDPVTWLKDSFARPRCACWRTTARACCVRANPIRCWPRGCPWFTCFIATRWGPRST